MTARTVEELAGLLGEGFAGDGKALVRDVSSLEEAGEGDLTYAADRRRLKLLDECRATAVIVPSGSAEADGNKNLIFAEDPLLAFIEAINLFRPPSRPAPGIDPRAAVHPSARVGRDVYIGPFAVVEEGASLGEGVFLYAASYVGKGAHVGAGSVIFPGVAILDSCIVGKRVIIHSGAVIGSDGFGFARRAGGYVKIPQTGIVRIEDDVEIGAGTTVDRATLGETVIGRGTKIDNLVQVAHNVTIGKNTVIAAQTGIAGSTRIGDSVQLGGQVGIGGHITIGDGTLVGAKSGIAQDISGGAWSGIPAIEHRKWLRAQSVYARLPELKKKLEELEERVRELEKNDGGRE